ncbi:MAG: polyprenyl-phospho-N-acetylgalactosaminyl synthase [Candidatus Woesearchaeota archaeon]|nr:polyprenyl-phospho-N-acetylgalactosaminyl synthase [Candidatus Woesearchaeota archaeon]MDN5327963.1 polyprenyl-phospho-N-acetylgalactosaminyl synthase [Candidatus Woesearchaeota archaeon]
MKSNKIFIVIPAYNEHKSLPKVLSELKSAGYKNIVLVDDGSSDDTSLIGIKNNVYTLRHPVNLGQGAALRTGILFALKQGADIIITFDADGQHQVSDIKNLVKPIIEGKAEVVLGSRFCKGSRVENIPLSRKILLKLAVLFTRVMSNIKVTDTHNGLRALSRRAAEKINITINGMAHASEILDEVSKHNLSFVEVPVTIKYTEYSLKKGQSKLNAFRIAFRFIIKKLLDW